MLRGTMQSWTSSLLYNGLKRTPSLSKLFKTMHFKNYQILFFEIKFMMGWGFIFHVINILYRDKLYFNKFFSKECSNIKNYFVLN